MNAGTPPNFPVSPAFIYDLGLYLPQPAPSAPNPPRQLNILLHNGNALRMNSTKIRVLEQMHHERLGCLLERLDGLRLPARGIDVGRQQREGDFSNLCMCNARC